MASGQLENFLRRLRTRALLDEGSGVPDAQLLESFVVRKDAAAFDALVRRHGLMVWGVCRRVVGHMQDAEDPFQATFLVLVRKAASVVPRAMVGNWLHGVAYRTAMTARTASAKRRLKERQVDALPEPEVARQDPAPDLLPLLDQELDRLPGNYRVAILLCDLQGKTHKQAARQLGWPVGTLSTRLVRGRAMLAKRLSRRGLAMSGGVLAAVLSQNMASAGVPNSVVSSTISAANLFAAGQAAAAGAISPKVAALTERVLKVMLMSKLKAVIAVVLVLGFMVSGGTVLSCRTAAAHSDKPPIAKTTPPSIASDKPPTAKERVSQDVNQAEKAFRASEKKLAEADTVQLIVNASMKVGEIKTKYKITMLMAKGNRARLDLSNGDAGKTHKFVLISDGAKTMTETTQGDETEKGTVEDTPKNANAIVAGAASRVGLFSVVRMARAGGMKWDQLTKIDDLVTVADFSIGKKEKVGERQAQRIDYKLTFVDDDQATFDAQVWLDSETNMPLKRILSGKNGENGEESFHVEETYDIRINGKIDASMFKLPK